MTPLVITKGSATGTRTRVFRVRAEHPNQLDYGGVAGNSRPAVEWFYIAFES